MTDFKFLMSHLLVYLAGGVEVRARLPDFFAFLRRPPHEGLWPYHCELGIRNCTLSGEIMFRNNSL